MISVECLRWKAVLMSVNGESFLTEYFCHFCVCCKFHSKIIFYQLENDTLVLLECLFNLMLICLFDVGRCYFMALSYLNQLFSFQNNRAYCIVLCCWQKDTHKLVFVIDCGWQTADLGFVFSHYFLALRVFTFSAFMTRYLEELKVPVLLALCLTLLIC